MTARVTSLGARLGVLAAAALLPLALATVVGDAPVPISVTVGGRPVLVESGARLRFVVRAFDLRPEPGRLRDVEGRVIDPSADPGAIFLNGSHARGTATLHDGDVVTVVDGADRTESTRRITTRLGRQPGDPEYSLATAHMVRVETVGRISGVVVSIDYRPVGRARRPRAVALTFDDGPWPRTTRAILRVLRKMNARATFFVIGTLAERYPRLVRRELRAGMSVGSHSWDHPEPFEDLSPRRMREELTATDDLLRERFGVRVAVFRPPGGSGESDVVTQAGLLGMRVVDWNVDPRDWSHAATPRSIARGVLSSVGPGSIVDLHDGGGDRRATVRALPMIIRGIRRMGLELVTVG